MPDGYAGVSDTDGLAEATRSAGPSWSLTRAISRVIVMALTMAALVWLLVALRGVLLLVALAIFLAYVLAPLVDRVCRPVTLRGREHVMPRALAVVVVYLLTFGSLAIGAALLLPLVGTQITQFAQQAPGYLDVARSRLLRWTASYEAYRLPAAIRDAINTGVMHTTEMAGKYVTEGLGGIIIQALGYLPRLLLIPVLAFFLLKDSAAFRTMALRMLPRGRWRSRGDQVLQDVNATLAVYIRSQLIACLLVGTICTIGFSLIGVPYALVLGLVAGILEFIPLVGPLVVALVAVLIASFVSVPQALTVVVFLGILRIAEDFVVYPSLIGRGMPLHPFAVIVAVLCGAELAGVPGIFLAIPLLAVTTVGHRHWLAHSGSEGLVADLLTATPKGPSFRL